jgi:hypothetical protein
MRGKALVSIMAGQHKMLSKIIFSQWLPSRERNIASKLQTVLQTVLCNNNSEWIKDKLYRGLATMDTGTNILHTGEIVNRKPNIQMVCLPHGNNFWTVPS